MLENVLKDDIEWSCASKCKVLVNTCNAFFYHYKHF